MSVYTLLSWASSMSTTLYLSSRKSWGGRHGEARASPGAPAARNSPRGPSRLAPILEHWWGGS